MARRSDQKRSQLKDSDESAFNKLILACEMFDFGVALMRENLRRSQPRASEAAIQKKLKRWLQTRPGAAFGDCPGRIRGLNLSGMKK